MQGPSADEAGRQAFDRFVIGLTHKVGVISGRRSLHQCRNVLICNLGFHPLHCLFLQDKGAFHALGPMIYDIKNATMNLSKVHNFSLALFGGTPTHCVKLRDPVRGTFVSNCVAVLAALAACTGNRPLDLFGSRAVAEEVCGD